MRGTELTVSLAWTPDHMELPTESDLCDLARQHGHQILTRGLPYAESVLGPGRVRADLAAGAAARVLCQRSRDADMVVTGSRGHGELPGLRLGSVAWQVAGHASGRVVVVRGAWRPANQPPGPVVLGADGSAAGQAAITFAFEEAALRDVPLVTVCALTDAPGPARREPPDGGGLRPDGGRRGEGTPRGQRGPARAGRHPARGPADRCGRRPAARGGGSRRGGLDEMSLGSIAQAVLQYAPCPVGVVHQAD